MGKTESVWKQNLNKNMYATQPCKDMHKYDARLVSFPGGILQMASLSWAFKYTARCLASKYYPLTWLSMSLLNSLLMCSKCLWKLSQFAVLEFLREFYYFILFYKRREFYLYANIYQLKYIFIAQCALNTKPKSFKSSTLSICFRYQLVPSSQSNLDAPHPVLRVPALIPESKSARE